jgi:hypothetical protein
MALSRLVLQTRKLACAPISRTMRPMVAVRSVATKAPEVADYAVEERVSTLLLIVPHAAAHSSKQQMVD